MAFLAHWSREGVQYSKVTGSNLVRERKREKESLIEIHKILIRVYWILICHISSHCFLPDTRYPPEK